MTSLDTSYKATRMESPVQMPIAQLMNLSDSELSELITEHRQPDGSVNIPVDSLSQQETGHLAARLRAAHARIIDTQSSKPLDVAYLQSRMTEFLNGQAQRKHHKTEATLPEPEQQSVIDQASQADDDSVTEVPDCDTYQYIEEEAYHDLVGDGGRPLYPLHLLRNVLDDPEKHQAMLRPFWCHPSYNLLCNEIFRRQLKRWQEFRHWQLDNRGLEEADNDYEAHVAKVRKEYTRIGYLDGLARMDADPSYLAAPGTNWWSQQKKRSWERAFQLESGCRQLRAYRIAACARLTRHGYGHLGLELNMVENPRQQGALTTWTEYLCFECWWLDHYAARLERLRLAHDAAWAKLQDSGLLLPQETAELVRSQVHVMGRSEAVNRDHKTYLAAEKAVASARNRDAAKPTLQNAIDRLQRAKASFDRALARSHAISSFIKDTRAYQNGKQDAERQPALVEWVARQVVLLQEETQRQEHPVTPPATSAAEPKCLKRKHHNDDGNNGKIDDDDDKHKKRSTRITKRRTSSTAAVTKNITTQITADSTASRRRRNRQSHTQNGVQGSAATDITKKKATVQIQTLRRSARIEAQASRQT